MEGHARLLRPGVGELPALLEPRNETSDDGHVGGPAHVPGAGYWAWLWLLVPKMQGLVDVSVFLLLKRIMQTLVDVAVLLLLTRVLQRLADSDDLLLLT